MHGADVTRCAQIWHISSEGVRQILFSYPLSLLFLSFLVMTALCAEREQIVCGSLNWEASYIAGAKHLSECPRGPIQMLRFMAYLYWWSGFVQLWREQQVTAWTARGVSWNKTYCQNINICYHFFVFSNNYTLVFLFTSEHKVPKCRCC